MQLVDRAERRLAALHDGEEVADRRRVEAVEPDVGDGVAPLDPQQRLGRGVAAGQAVGPVGADEEHGTGPRAGVHRRQRGQPLEHRDALGVGPVQVLEDDQRGAAGGQPPHQVGRRPHPLVRAPLDVAHRGVEGGELGVGGAVGLPHAVEGVEHELQGAAERARVRLAGEHQRDGRRRVDQFLDEPGLADPGLARDQGDGRAGSGAEQADEAVELGRPAHHHGRQTGAAGEHGHERNGGGAGPQSTRSVRRVRPARRRGDGRRRGAEARSSAMCSSTRSFVAS